MKKATLSLSLSLSNRLKNPTSLVFCRTCRRTGHNKLGFTIVELLVVIVVIGVLAAITIVSYTGISSKATVSALQSDLSSAKKQIALYYIDHGAYPVDLDTNKCPRDSTPTTDTKYCLKSSSGNRFDYLLASPNSLYTLTNTNTASSTVYSITNNSSPTAISSLVATDPTNWLAIGTQVWAKANLNVGTMVTGVTAQTNNSILEKYCYANTESNCTTYGGLYQWDEAMQYVITAGAQGICPTGSHIPTDAEYKTLEMQLGTTQAQADLNNAFRGTDQGTQLKSGGASGLNMLIAGFRNNSGTFGYLSSYTDLWSSSESGANAWYRGLKSDLVTANRSSDVKGYGFSVRCLGN